MERRPAMYETESSATSADEDARRPDDRRDAAAFQRRPRPGAHIIYTYTRRLSYSYVFLAAELTSLEARRDKLSRDFFLDVCDPSSPIHHLLPPPRDTSLLSRLRAATPFPRLTSRTKKHCSFITYTLNHYQSKISNNS